MPASNRVVTRIQDQDDAPALGAPQDGYILVWDNATSRFVATAPGGGGLLAANNLSELTATQATARGNIGAGDTVEYIVIACSDETTALTVATAVARFRMPFAMTLTEVRLSVNTAPTGSTLTVNVKDSGTTIFSTKPTIDAGEKTSTTAATPAVISDAALASDAEITIDRDTVGSIVAGAGLKVTLIGTRA